MGGPISTVDSLTDRPNDPPIYTGLLREQRLVETFVAVTDTLVRDFDALDMLGMLTERCAELLRVAAAGIILTGSYSESRADRERPTLSVAAASSERSRLLEVFAVATEDGPCMDCLRTARPVVCGDLALDGARRWPRFAAGAAEAGFRSAHAIPMRLRDEVLGVLTLLHTEPHVLDEADARLGQALADAATIGLLHERAVRHAQTAQEQLQGALTSRVIVEQAKGVVAGQAGTTPEEAFSVVRTYARNRGLRLSDVARSVVTGTLDLSAAAGPGS